MLIDGFFLKLFSYRFLDGPPLVGLGNASGNFSLAMLWFTTSAFVIFILMRSASVGLLTRAPSSRK